MKFLLVLLLLILAGVLYVVFGPSSNSSSEKMTPAEKAAMHHPKEKSSLGHEINQAVEYGVGYTQFEAGQRMKKQIHQINAQHTKQLEKAMKQ